jgi:hypothetical protein
VEEARLAYRVRSAEASDAKPLRDAIGSTLAHPDHQGGARAIVAPRVAVTSTRRYDRPGRLNRRFRRVPLRADDNSSFATSHRRDDPDRGYPLPVDQAFNPQPVAAVIAASPPPASISSAPSRLLPRR